MFEADEDQLRLSLPDYIWEFLAEHAYAVHSAPGKRDLGHLYVQLQAIIELLPTPQFDEQGSVIDQDYPLYALRRLLEEIRSEVYRLKPAGPHPVVAPSRTVKWLAPGGSDGVDS